MLPEPALESAPVLPSLSSESLSERSVPVSVSEPVSVSVSSESPFSSGMISVFSFPSFCSIAEDPNEPSLSAYEENIPAPAVVKTRLSTSSLAATAFLVFLVFRLSIIHLFLQIVSIIILLYFYLRPPPALKSPGRQDQPQKLIPDDPKPDSHKPQTAHITECVGTDRAHEGDA